MLDGRLIRLFVLTVLLLAPLSAAAPPDAHGNTASGTNDQEITDMAADPTGQFAATVVAFDNAKASVGTGGLPLPGGTPAPGTSPHKDIYICNYGPATNTPNVNCAGRLHNGFTPATQIQGAPQKVDAAVRLESGGQGWYAVAGPGGAITLWSQSSDNPFWTRFAADNQQAISIAIAPDASRVVAGIAPTTPTAGGRIVVYNGTGQGTQFDGTLYWSLALKNLEGAEVRPTSLDYARQGGILAIGTNAGLLLTNAAGGAPGASLGGMMQPGTVHNVTLSRDGKYVAVAGSNGLIFAPVKAEAARYSIDTNSIFVSNPSAAQDVAMSLDGSRFAGAFGESVRMFRRVDGGIIAERIGTQDTPLGARVTDMAYSDNGQLLVVIAGNKVYGFGPDKSTPIWDFDATQTAFGSVDGPLRRVSVSDDAQRIIVAGKTKTMVYQTKLAVTAAVNSTNGLTRLLPTQTIPLALELRNTGSLVDNYTFGVELPVAVNPWVATPASGFLRVDPGAVGTFHFNVTAPAGQTDGTFGVKVKVQSAAANELAQRRNLGVAAPVAGPTFNITIPRSVVLKVEAPDAPVTATQGAAQTISFNIRNEGNAEGVVNLSATQELTRGASWAILFQPDKQVRVPPGNNPLLVTMSITPPTDAGDGDMNVITIRAREGETVEATDRIVASVNPQWSAELRTNKSVWSFFPAQSQIITLNVTNTGNTNDVYNLSANVAPTSGSADWRVTLSAPQVQVERGQTKVVSVSVKALASEPRDVTLTLVAQSQTAPDRRESTLVLNLQTTERPPPDDKIDDKLIPAPGVALLLVLVAAVALSRRLGGRR